MTNVNEWLRGKKTYLVAALSIVIGLLQANEGSTDYGTLLVIIGAGLVTMRSALNNL